MKWNEKLREIRTAKGLTQEQAAKRMVPPMTGGGWSHWETGRRVPNSRELPRIAAALDVALAELVADDPAFAANEQEQMALFLLRRIPDDQRELALRLLGQLMDSPG